MNEIFKKENISCIGVVSAKKKEKAVKRGMIYNFRWGHQGWSHRKRWHFGGKNLKGLRK